MGSFLRHCPPQPPRPRFFMRIFSVHLAALSSDRLLSDQRKPPQSPRGQHTSRQAVFCLRLGSTATTGSPTQRGGRAAEPLTDLILTLSDRETLLPTSQTLGFAHMWLGCHAFALFLALASARQILVSCSYAVVHTWVICLMVGFSSFHHSADDAFLFCTAIFTKTGPSLLISRLPFARLFADYTLLQSHPLGCAPYRTDPAALYIRIGRLFLQFLNLTSRTSPPDRPLGTVDQVVTYRHTHSYPHLGDTSATCQTRLGPFLRSLSLLPNRHTIQHFRFFDQML